MFMFPDLDPLDPQDFGFLDPDPQKYAASGSMGLNINQKLQNPLNCCKREVIQIS